MLSLDNLLREIGQLTEEFVARLSMLQDEEVEEFMDRREELVNQITSIELSPEQREQYRDRFSDILRYDDVILSRLTTLREEARIGMNKIASGRTQKAGYEKAYAMNSAFVDKRK